MFYVLNHPVIIKRLLVANLQRDHKLGIEFKQLPSTILRVTLNLDNSAQEIPNTLRNFSPNISLNIPSKKCAGTPRARGVWKEGVWSGSTKKGPK